MGDKLKTMTDQRQMLALAQEKIIRMKILEKMALEFYDDHYFEGMDIMCLLTELMIETTRDLDDLLFA